MPNQETISIALMQTDPAPYPGRSEQQRRDAIPELLVEDAAHTVLERDLVGRVVDDHRELPEDVECRRVVRLSLVELRQGLKAEQILLVQVERVEVAVDGLLDVALTKRNGMYMCGVPHHAAEGYIGKLIKAGKRAWATVTLK